MASSEGLNLYFDVGGSTLFLRCELYAKIES
jgi:hypothetical protein